MAVKLGSLHMGISIASCLFRTSCGRFLRPSSEVGQLSRYLRTNIQPPKRPLTAFFEFLSQKRADIKRNNPDAKVYEVASIAGQMWKDVSEEEKQVLRERAHRRMEAYKVQLAHFMEELTPEERAELKESKRIHKKKLRHRRRVTELHKLGKPKRPASPFSIFVRASKLERGDMSPTDFVKELADRWRHMSPQQKQMYQDEASMDRERYYEEIAEWEERMIREGRPDLVRGYHKKKPSKRSRRKRKPGRRRTRRKPRNVVEDSDQEYDSD